MPESFTDSPKIIMDFFVLIADATCRYFQDCSHHCIGSCAVCKNLELCKKANLQIYRSNIKIAEQRVLVKFVTNYCYQGLQMPRYLLHLIQYQWLLHVQVQTTPVKNQQTAALMHDKFDEIIPGLH